MKQLRKSSPAKIPDMNLRAPKFDMAIALLLVCSIAIASKFSLDLLVRFMVIAGFTILIEYIFWKVRRVPNFFPSAGFVTAFIVFLLSEPTTPIYLVLLAPTFAILQKQFIRPWGNHIFNPAAFGLFASSFFGNIISWWGTNINFLAFWAIIFACGYVSQLFVRHWKITVPFWITTILIVFLRSGSFSQGFSQFTVGAFIFFSLVMLPEPMTAPGNDLNKYFYGALIGILGFVIAGIPFVQDPLIASLLLANLGFEVLENLGTRQLVTRN